MSNAIKGHEAELPFTHYIKLSNMDEQIEVKSSPPYVIIKNKKTYNKGETKSTGDHEFTYYYYLVETLNLDI